MGGAYSSGGAWQRRLFERRRLGGALIREEALGKGAYSRGGAWEGRLFERRRLGGALIREEALGCGTCSRRARAGRAGRR